jgi:hypothetical protein
VVIVNVVVVVFVVAADIVWMIWPLLGVVVLDFLDPVATNERGSRFRSDRPVSSAMPQISGSRRRRVVRRRTGIMRH